MCGELVKNILGHVRIWKRELPNLSELPNGVWSLGVTKYTCRALGLSLLADWAKTYVVIDGKHLMITFSELAKIALSERLELLGKRRANFTPEPSLTHPLFSKPGVYEGDWAYVDLKNAYHTVISRFYPSVFSIKHQILSCPHDFNDRLTNLNSKPSRVSCFGVIRSRNLTLAKVGKEGVTINYRTTRNRFFDDTPNLVYALMHSVASFCVHQLGAIYIHTDGAIIPARRIDDYLEFVSNLGFRAGVKARGDVAVVKGVGVYAVGDKTSKHFAQIRMNEEYSNLIEIPSWLNTKYSKLVCSSHFGGRAGL